MPKHLSNQRYLISVAPSTGFAQLGSRYALPHVVARTTQASRPAMCLYDRIRQVAPIIQQHIIIVGNDFNYTIDPVELLGSEAADVSDLEPGLSDHVFDTFQVLIGDGLLV
jgi:hypothetical protein